MDKNQLELKQDILALLKNNNITLSASETAYISRGLDKLIEKHLGATHVPNPAKILENLTKEDQR